MTEEITVSREDRLELENAQLRFMVCTQKASLTTLQLQLATKEQNEAQKEMLEKKQKLEEKYGISLDSHTIGEDGTVGPRTPAAGLKDMLEKLRTT